MIDDPKVNTRAVPWYREPWPWLLMLGPAVVVVAAFVTLWLAVRSSDGLVADDYYKQGLAINQTLARGDRAKAMELSARLRIDGTNVVVILRAREGVNLADRIRLSFAHPTRGGLDRVVNLDGSAVGYRGTMPDLSNGRWQVLLEDPDGMWRLSGAARLPDIREIELGPGD